VLSNIPKKYTIAAIIFGFFIILTLVGAPTRKADANASKSREVFHLALTTKQEKSVVPPPPPSYTHSQNNTSESLQKNVQAALSLKTKAPVTPQPATKTTKPDITDHTFTIKKGDTLSALFSRAGFNDRKMYEVLNADKDKTFRRIHPNEKITFATDPDHKLITLTLEEDELNQYQIYLDDNVKYQSKHIKLQPEIVPAYVQGSISDSLFLDGEKAGLSQSQIMELTRIFGWDIDFALDIREGDSFSVLYEKRFLNGKRIPDGKILVATFTNKGKTHKAILFTRKDNTSDYFSPDGQSLRTAFLRTPIPLARISSHFNLHRKHPVLHRIRAHKGTDYAAVTGTPIHSTADGRVISVGWHGGYGRAVIIRHSHNISTLYAHMSRFKRGIHAGSRVRQGQTIGYVGQSGLATGPHLHYEYRVNGIQRDAEKVKFPHAASVPDSQLAAFKKQSHIYLAQLETFEQSYSIALNKQK
jgi:murein DD-endopeptidase MepM/ murein hydrolase activator NlpD